MTRIVTVPLGTLTLSQHNIRRTGRDKNIEQLAASIFAEGLLQNLTVARIPPDESQPAERYEVLAGGRRLRALQLLQQRDILPPSLLTDVPVNIVAPEIANEVGIAENTIRETMHAHDEFVAFRDLSADGHSDDDIAHRFGLSVVHVRRVLKLANVSPVLLRLFREDKLDRERLRSAEPRSGFGCTELLGCRRLSGAECAG
jgi:ParB family chromosome partitioning protein